MSRRALFEQPQPAIAHRQAQLRIPLSAEDAARPAASITAARDAVRLSAAAGLTGVQWVFDSDELARLTGQPTPASIWGWSERAADPPIAFVDLAQCRTRGVAFGVQAHELTHLTHYGRGYSRHSAAWWARVQHLLDELT